jgi:hypothetical protein
MLIHMLLKYHNSDYKQLGNEDAVMAAVRDGNPGQGVHSFPHVADMKDFGDKGVQARFARGPVGFVIVGPNGMPAMGKLLGQQVAHFLVGTFLVAYCASLVLEPGASYYEVFRFVMTAAFLTFGWASIPYSIWYGIQWSTTAKFLLDALIYSAVIAGAFAGFWPGSP